MADFMEYLDIVKLSSDGKTSTIEILKVGTIYDRGIKITEEMLDDYITNFEKGIYGTELQVNLKHDREGEAAGWIKKVYKLNGVLLADVEWTQLGIDKITSKQFRYTSSELSLSYTEPKTGAKVKNVLIGVALTNIPAVKGMAPVTLSEESPFSTELFLSLKSETMKVKAMYDGLMKKDAISEKEMAEFADACKAAGDEVPATEMADMKKKLAAKAAKKLSEGDDENEGEGDDDQKKADESKEEAKLAETNKDVVSLSAFNKMKKLVEEKDAKTAKLQERLDRMDLKEVVSKKLTLSEDVMTGFMDDDATLSEVVDFMIGLSPEQRTKFSELVGKVQTVDLSVIGSTTAKKTASEDKADIALAEAQARAKKLSQETGREYADCLSEEYAKLDEAKV